MKPYEQLDLIPSLVAQQVVDTPYEGKEISGKVFRADLVAKVEAARQNLSEEHRQEFIELCDKSCRNAYNAQADWFMKIIRSRSNKGRDMLYATISHWLSSYVTEPNNLRRRAESVA